jgi:hypothetical protein
MTRSRWGPVRRGGREQAKTMDIQERTETVTPPETRRLRWS